MQTYSYQQQFQKDQGWERRQGERNWYERWWDQSSRQRNQELEAIDWESKRRAQRKRHYYQRQGSQNRWSQKENTGIRKIQIRTWL